MTTGAANGTRRALPRHAVPAGPRGLWGALANASTPRVVAKALPVSDLSTLGAAVPGMFAYDPELAVSLGEELDPSVLLG